MICFAMMIFSQNSEKAKEKIQATPCKSSHLHTEEAEVIYGMPASQR